ncbi:acyltransferase [Pseudomonas sp. HMWF006]|uniref:acyltransferase family protein n=1 Tax=Pseudomonas sp. HMWF006 TaxID=2056843 RepID=UPI000D42B9F2|nr:acyltransferase [Pseudomonas sp. HMWF006]PTT00664.1 acyltransferase [Pseudomonas sp. HMWF006]PTT69025.1 acyltransferase [Pseudomonas sp. HMWF007]PTT94335.1 acyltransferase [Pseudomonas sp. HMWF005]
MSSRKNLEIEYLRGAAVAMTLLSHVNMLLPFHVDVLLRIFSIFMPWTGVDLFFCISGFVVSKAYLDYFDKHRAQGQFGLAAACFWLRRAYRLLPTAWLWILIPLIFSIAFNQSNIFGSWFDNLRSFTAVATFSGNLANQYNSLLGPSPQYWSLALEEQFYFVFPFFLLFITAPRWRVIALFALIALQFGLDRNPFGNPASSMLSSFRLDAMLWGILLCLFTRTRLYQQIEPVGLGQGMLKPLLCTLFLLYMLGAIATQLIAMPIAVGLIAIVAVLIVWLASYQKGYIYCPAVLRGFMQWLGSRSYGLYVIHVFANHLSTEIWTRVAASQDVPLDGRFTLELLLTSVGLLLVLSELNYRFIETPLRLRGAEIARRKLNQEAAPEPAEVDVARLPAK